MLSILGGSVIYCVSEWQRNGNGMAIGLYGLWILCVFSSVMFFHLLRSPLVKSSPIKSKMNMNARLRPVYLQAFMYTPSPRSPSTSIKKKEKNAAQICSDTQLTKHKQKRSN